MMTAVELVSSMSKCVEDCVGGIFRFQIYDEFIGL